MVKRFTLPDTEPYTDSKGNTMVPIRFISEKLGAKVLWDNTNQVVTINMDFNTIVMPVGSKSATVNGETISLSAAATKKEGRVVVPLRFVSEALGVTVKWDQASYAINYHKHYLSS